MANTLTLQELTFRVTSSDKPPVEVMGLKNAELQLSEIESLLRSGDLLHARARLLKIPFRSIPREQYYRFAGLARRSHLTGLSLKLLNPLVRPSGKGAAKATDKERAEYAASLSFIGAVPEAIRILETIPQKEVPEALLFQAFAHFSEWNYAVSIPLLDTYIGLTGISDYERLVGRTNLAAALVHERDPRALPLLEQLLKEVEPGPHAFVLGYTLLLLGEHFINLKSWKDAGEALQRAEKVLANNADHESLFAKKWSIFLELYRNGRNEKSIQELNAIRERARDLKHWETLRHCDYHEAIALKDRPLIEKLYFGTPFPHFRSQLLQDANWTEASLPISYDWQPLNHKKTTECLDLLSQETGGTTNALRLGKNHHQLVAIFLSDFYRPMRTATLFTLLNPQDFFNPVSSPQRVRMAVYRLRKWLDEHMIPIEIFEDGEGYRLISEWALKVPRKSLIGDSADIQIQELREKMGQTPSFTARDVSSLLGISRWAAIRLIKRAKEAGHIEQLREGKNSSYTLTPSTPQKRTGT